MKSDSPLWHVLGEPAQSHEAVALERLRDLLPDDGITTAWVNTTVVSPGGRADEIDALLLTRAGLFVLELKGWHGLITGTMAGWIQDTKHQRRYHKSAYILANEKAKRLSSILKDAAKQVPGNPKTPFISARVVFHGEQSTVKLDGPAAENILALDGYHVRGLEDRAVSDFLAAPPNHAPIDLTQAKRIRAIIEHSGLVATPKQRRIGDYVLDDANALGDGPGWYDLLVSHPVTKLQRRLRVFEVPPGSSKSAREQLEMAAKREVAFTEGLKHSGIAGVIDYLDTENGPALLFDFNPDEVALDLYLGEFDQTIQQLDRLDLIRRIGEVLRYAHARRVTHRALTPASVMVNRETGEVRVRDWSAAKRSSNSTTTATIVSGGVENPNQLVDHSAWLYLAPESLRQSTTVSPVALDVYGFGALSYLILTSEAPAANLAALQQLIADPSRSLDPRAILPDLNTELANLVAQATAFDELNRTIDVDEVLRSLDQAIDAMTKPEDDSESRVAGGDPIDANQGETIAERFIVLDRRGSGTTGTALLVDDVERGREGVILKLARDDAAVERLAVEAHVLKGLQHPRIVRLLEGPVDVAGRQALIVSDAGSETLARKIQNEGRATIEQLERFGNDLIEAVAYLESKSVFHRDIKPANLAVAPDAKTRSPRLNLFDFSLAKEPLRKKASGSKPYLDPFLVLGKRPQYDRAAELYAVAVTLFELAVGTPPWWVVGEDVPANAADRVALTETMFDPGVGAGLRAFFERAFDGDTAKRFANAVDFGIAWRALFAGVDAVTGDGDEANAERAAAATLSTSLTSAGLSARQLSALSRLGVATVGELLDLPSFRINSIPGMGEKVRKTIVAQVRDWRQRLFASAEHIETDVSADVRLSVEQRVAKLIPREGSKNTGEISVLNALLLGASVAGDEAVAGGAPSAWPGLNELVARTGLGAGTVASSIESATARWRKSGVLAPVIEVVKRVLAESAGVATAEELALSLLLTYGSLLPSAERIARAVSLLRAVIETDDSLDGALFRQRRSKLPGSPMVLALDTDADDRPDRHGASASVLLTVAIAAGTEVDRALESDGIIAAATMRERLHGTVPESALLDEGRLLTLAAAASRTGARSSVGEMYRVGLDGEMAVAGALRGSAIRELTEAQVRHRVSLRFPRAAVTPMHPKLDAVVKRTHPHLTWQGDAYRPQDTDLATYSSTRATTTLSAPLSTSALNERLTGSLRSKGALALTVHPAAYRSLQRVIAQRYGLEIVDFAQALVERARLIAVEKNIKWPVLLQADGKSADSVDFSRATQVVRLAIGPFWRDLVTQDRPLLITNAGVLARYGLTGLLDEVADLATERPAARWLLVPHRPDLPAPDLEGKPIPFGADRWVPLPSNPTELSFLLTGNEVPS
ncbi:BREX system serine/threonine kinase PglW [Mycetocola sp. 2940]|uniref:BREX system serine/threonine kinase PglW n=1 Tax=Mycetocola sp. 2940 TaxID=3156452 RepID=UPI0033929773